MSTSVVLERYPVDPAGNTSTYTTVLKRQRVYIFPTTQGWVYGVMLIVMLLGAINYNNSMAFMLCFLLAGLALVCMLHTYRNLTGLIINSKRPEAVFAGQQALFPIQFDNHAGIARFSIQIEKHKRLKERLINKKDNARLSISIPANKLTTTRYPYPATKRGLLKPGVLKISSCFPLGLFSAWSYFEPEEYCLVYPVPDGKKQLPLNIIENENADFGIESGTDDFSGFRKYRPGDRINSIAWKPFAREQGLLVKQFNGKGSQILMLNWESVSNLNDIEARLSQLCYWIILADKAGMTYGLEIPAIQIEPAYGLDHRNRCLETLARYGQIDERK